jgi:hypothetical protein
MSGFSTHWLALREPYDRAARSPTVLAALVDAFRDRADLALVDLACGTGATVRAIASHLPARQRWRLVDNDLSLLAQAAALGAAPQLVVTGRPVDLARDLELALEPPLDLVTTSALIDLVSPEWLDRLVVETAARRLPVYAALSYDGRVVLEPALDHDGEIVTGFNRHQRTDKGFGPALGPLAAARAVESFERVGYAVVHGASDWVLGFDDREMQEALFAGFAAAAAPMTALPERTVADWLMRRRAALARGRSRLRVGHLDIFARATGTR